MVEIRNLTADEVIVRVGTCSEKGASFLLYKDARCDMNILDEVFGVFGWQREHSFKGDKEFCKVSVFDKDTNQWISKEDTGVESLAEKEKGQSSDAFKRACVNIGIGRELYTSPFIFINVPTEPKGNGWTLKKPYPSFKVTKLEVQNHKITGLEIANKATGEIVYTFPRKVAEKPKNEAKTNDYELPICEMCGGAITPMGGFTTQKIIEITKNKTGKQLCSECYKKVRANNG